MYSYEAELSRPIMAKAPDFERNGRLKHVILSHQFNRSLLDRLCGIADKIRIIAKQDEGRSFLRYLLDTRRAMLYFTQPSTRTFLSFMASCQMLGLTCNEIRDPRVSSEYKGETAEDSVRMFSSYFDLIIMRSVIPDLAERCAYMMNDLEQFNQRSVPIINGGAGADEHPTQALLDIYTLKRTFEFYSPGDSPDSTRFESLRRKYEAQGVELTQGIDNKAIAFVGDIGRGRTVRSLVHLLGQYRNVSLFFVSPNQPKLRLQDDIRAYVEARSIPVMECFHIEEVLDKVDAVYMTRIQSEHDDPEVGDFLKNEDLSKFWMTSERARRMREYAPIMHPFPRNKEIGIEVDTDPRAMYFRQARNGMWVRAALVAYLFDKDYDIGEFHTQNYSEYQTYNRGVLRH